MLSWKYSQLLWILLMAFAMVTINATTISITNLRHGDSGDEPESNDPDHNTSGDDTLTANATIFTSNSMTFLATITTDDHGHDSTDFDHPTGVSVTGATATTDPDRKGGSTGASMTSIATATITQANSSAHPGFVPPSLQANGAASRMITFRIPWL